MHQPSSPRAEELLRHAGWVRALARQLVMDEARAEDAVQETWLAALRRPPQRRQEVRGWLATVLRNVVRQTRRTEARRMAREREVASPEQIADTADVVERARLQRMVVDLLLALEEPYRTTVLLRFFDGLPPRAIAKRLGVHPPTVRTHLKRGLEKLRSRLDEQHGGERGAWCLSLWHLASAGSPVAKMIVGSSAGLGPALLGVVAMSTKVKLVLVACIVMTGSLLTWLAVSWRSESARSGIVPRDATEVREAAHDARREEPPAGRRENAYVREPLAEGEVGAATQPHGSLQVHVVWGRDGSPAAGIGVVCYPSGESNRHLRSVEGETDARGIFAVDRIHAGKVHIAPIPGGGLTTLVKPGEQNEATVEVPAAMTIEGIVVHDGRPVPGAEIWLSEGEHFFAVGHVATHAAADGSFVLRDVSEGRYLRARARGFSPSVLAALGPKREGTVRMRLVLPSRSGEITGRVFGEGQPLAGAVVRLGAEGPLVGTRLEDGSQALKGVSQRVRTDADGRFRFPGAEPGPTPLVARMSGWAPWIGAIEVQEGSLATTDIHLVRGASVTGVVKDAEHRIAADVEISTGPGESLEASATSSAEDGSYRLEDIAPGDVTVRVHAGVRGAVSTTLSLTAGDEVVWDPVLPTTGQITGRVIDEADRPLENHRIIALVSSERGLVGNASLARTDAQGRFVLENCAEAIYQLSVFDAAEGPFPLAKVGGVRSGPDEVILRVVQNDRPSAFIEGVVVDGSGNYVGSASVRAKAMSPGMSDAFSHTNASTGQFRVGPLPSGRFALEVDAIGLPILRVDARDLTREETWNVGTLTMQPGGRLVAKLRRFDGGAIAGLSLSLFDAQGHSYKVFQESSEARSGLLAPGVYRLCASENAAGGVVFLPLSFQITRGEEEVRLTHVLRPGVYRSVVLTDERDPASRSDTRARVRVLDEHGEIIQECAVDLESRGDGAASLTLVLAVGTYWVEVGVGDVIAEQILEVPELSAQKNATVIRIK